MEGWRKIVKGPPSQVEDSSDRSVVSYNSFELLSEEEQEEEPILEPSVPPTPTKLFPGDSTLPVKKQRRRRQRRSTKGGKAGGQAQQPKSLSSSPPEKRHKQGPSPKKGSGKTGHKPSFQPLLRPEQAPLPPSPNPSRPTSPNNLQLPQEVVAEESCAISSLATPSLSAESGRKHAGDQHRSGNQNSNAVSQSSQSTSSTARNSTAPSSSTNRGSTPTGGQDNLDEESEEEGKENDKMDTEFDTSDTLQTVYTRVLFQMTYDEDTQNFKDRATSEFGELFGAIKEEDTQAALIPWYTSNQDTDHSILATVKDIRDLGQIKREQYFHQLRCPVNTNAQGFRTIYANVHLRHSMDSHELINRLDEVLRNTKFSVSVPSLQVEKKKEVGWFLRSHPHTRKHRLEEAILKDLGIQCELRWKPVNPFKRNGIRWTTADAQTKALHIFIEDGPQFRTEQATLEEAYNSKATSWPMNLKLRFVPILHYSCVTSKQHTSFQEIRTRQLQIITQLETPQVSSIIPAALDTEFPEWEGQSLRDILMQIRTRRNRATHLFLDISKSWMYREEDQEQNPVVCCYSPYFAKEATDWMATLIPRLRYQLRVNFGNDGLKPMQQVFTQMYLEYHKEDVYDPNSNTVTSKRDRELAKLAKEGEDEFGPIDLAALGISEEDETHLAPKDTFGHDARTLASVRSKVRDSVIAKSRVVFQAARTANEGRSRSGSGAPGSTAGAK